MKSKQLGRILGATLIACSPFSAGVAGSCCGGGSGATILLPKAGSLLGQASLAWERYDGYWDSKGTWKADPPGSDLNQYRLSLGAAYRFADHWQGSVSLPFVINRNQYSGLSSNTEGLGDTSLNLWYEAFDNAMCVFKVRSLADLKPAVYWGLGLTVPTGISPYDNVDDNFDITGRGFYRLDGNVIIDKTVYPWTGAINLGYGVHLERPVNRDYGTYVEPYDKKLGDRRSASVSFGYVHFTPDMNELTTTLGISYLHEGQAAIDGERDTSSGMEKRAVSLAMAYTTQAKDWVVKGSYSRTPHRNDWGRNFPTTNTFSLGVSHVFQ